MRFEKTGHLSIMVQLDYAVNIGNDSLSCTEPHTVSNIFRHRLFVVDMTI